MSLFFIGGQHTLNSWSAECIEMAEETPEAPETQEEEEELSDLTLDSWAHRSHMLEGFAAHADIVSDHGLAPASSIESPPPEVA